MLKCLNTMNTCWYVDKDLSNVLITPDQLISFPLSHPGCAARPRLRSSQSDAAAPLPSRVTMSAAWQDAGMFILGGLKGGLQTRGRTLRHNCAIASPFDDDSLC